MNNFQRNYGLALKLKKKNHLFWLVVSNFFLHTLVPTTYLDLLGTYLQTILGLA